MSTRSAFYGTVGAIAIGFFAVGGAVVESTHGFQARAADLAAVPNVSCSLTTACATDANALSGPGLNATSKGGSGLTASTSFKSTSSTKFAAGVVGTDASASGQFDAGVEGKSTRGIGMIGTSASLLNPGVLGVSTGSGFGVEGEAITGSGFATGVLAIGNTTGLSAEGHLNTSTSIVANSAGGPLFVGNENGTEVFSIDGLGDLTANTAAAVSFSGRSASLQTSDPGPAVFGVAAGTGVYGASSSSSSPTGAVAAQGSGGFLFEGFDSSLIDVFNVDNSGNISISGQIFTSGACSTGCIRTGPSQTRVVSYAPRESQPTMEDVGEAQLVNGEARVALDPAFANVIDKNTPYLVFAMPEGDCKGLFIAAKSAAGFTVHELQGGRSSLAFEYRIVARPFADRSPRLPFVRVRPLPHELAAMWSHHATR